MKRILSTAALIAFAASGALAHEILHSDHSEHAHGEDCGHTSIVHAGHIDYLHDGHLHHAHGDHVDEHAIAITSTNPEAEELAFAVEGEDHMHGHDGEEHMMVQHGTHFDYIHDGRLHHVHGDHTDDHGPITTVATALASR